MKLIATLRGHSGFIGRIAWSPDGLLLASPAEDKTIRLWNAKHWQCSHVLQGHQGEVFSVAFGSCGAILASGSSDNTVKLWDPIDGTLKQTLEWSQGSVNSVAFDASGTMLAIAGDTSAITLWKVNAPQPHRILEGRQSVVNSVTFDPAGGTLVSAGIDHSLNLWDVANGELLRSLKGHRDSVNSVAFDPKGRILYSGSADNTVRLWDVATGRQIRTLEGPTDRVRDVAVSADGKLFAAKCQDDTVRIWLKDSLEQVALLVEPARSGQPTSLAFHPHLPLLATVGSDPGTHTDEVIHIWEFNETLLRKPSTAIGMHHYVNAKIVLLGDTGVGKSGLSLVLNQQPFEATESTPGRRVFTLLSDEVTCEDGRKLTREALLWDLAGQPGYRVIHQLHLNEIAVAVLVFDARSEIDPLSGVRHWDRALRLAQQRQGPASVPMKKFLVSARSDRGIVSVSRDRIASLMEEVGFDGYFETSAKEGWQIPELRHALLQSIPWKELPEVSSSSLFTKIKSYLLTVKQSGRLIVPVDELCEEFVRLNPLEFKAEPNLLGQFQACIGRSENRDLIRRLSFGGYVLLQPELLDAYASAMVNAAKEEPDGLGSISEDAILAGQFYIPSEQKIKHRGHEQLLLHATVEELTQHDLALRENSLNGRFLVFPSQFNRDYEDAPEPTGKALAVTFEGPVQSLYSTLAVRLGHSGLFTVVRSDMWRNAAIFTASAGGRCGLYLQEFAEAKGRLIVFYEVLAGKFPTDETRYNFEQFVITHVDRHSVEKTMELIRFCVCPGCGDPVPDSYVQRLRSRGIMTFSCPCGSPVSLTEPFERLQFASKVDSMERAADDVRDFEVFVESARGEAQTPSFKSWAGDDRVTLAIVFTDIAGSTALVHSLKEERMQDVLRAHFSRSRELIDRFKGRELKTLGDGLMAVFRSVEKALDYATALQADPGDPKLRIRAGIHIGPMLIDGNDVFGNSVNFAARVVNAAIGSEIWVSDQAKEHLDKSGLKQHLSHQWLRHADQSMKGFDGCFTLWSLQNQVVAEPRD